MFLAVGTVAAGLHGRLPATGVLIACAAVAGGMSFAAEPVASVLLAGIGWLTTVGFSRPPYAQLRPTGPAAVHAAVVIGACALAGAGLGLVFRWYARRLTLVSMGTYTGMRARRPALKAARAARQCRTPRLRAGRRPWPARSAGSAAAGWSREWSSPPPGFRCSPRCSRSGGST